MVGKLTPDDELSCSVLPQIIDPDFPYGTPAQALRRCLDAREGKEAEFKGNEQTHLGNLFEPIILQEGCDRLGLTDVELDIQTPFKHPTLPLWCSLDGRADGQGKTFVTDPDKGIYVIGQDEITLTGIGPLDAKNTGPRVEDQPVLWRGPIQLQGQMACIGATWGALFVLHQGSTMRVFLFALHPQMQKKIHDSALDFEKRLNSDPVDWYDIEHHSDPITIYPDVEENQPPKILPAYIEELAKTIVLAKEAQANFDMAVEDATLAIQSHMGNHEKAYAGKYEIKWPVRNYKAQPAKTVDAKPAHSKRMKSIIVKEMGESA